MRDDDAQQAFSKLQLGVAERELRKATTVYPEFADAWTLLGRVHEKLSEPEQAKKDYQQALSADSRLAEPYRELAEILVPLG